MQIVFDLGGSFDSDSVVADAETLTSLLEGLVAINRVYLRHHTVPTLYRSGVVYGRTRVWDSIPALYSRGYGDCKSLSAAKVAELREQGIKARCVHRIAFREDGSNLFHILVQRPPCAEAPDGWEDPSRVLGMGGSEWAHFRA